MEREGVGEGEGMKRAHSSQLAETRCHYETSNLPKMKKCQTCLKLFQSQRSFIVVLIERGSYKERRRGTWRWRGHGECSSQYNETICGYETSNLSKMPKRDGRGRQANQVT